MLEYSALRDELHAILDDFINREHDCLQDGEFDWEYQEMTVDEILRIIREQGGTYY